MFGLFFWDEFVHIALPYYCLRGLLSLGFCSSKPKTCLFLVGEIKVFD